MRSRYSKPATFAVLNERFVDRTGQIDAEYFCHLAILQLDNSYADYCYMRQLSHSAYDVCWTGVRHFIDQMLHSTYEDCDYYASRDHVRAWMLEHGQDERMLDPILAHIAETRKELAAG